MRTITFNVPDDQDSCFAKLLAKMGGSEEKMLSKAVYLMYAVAICQEARATVQVIGNDGQRKTFADACDENYVFAAKAKEAILPFNVIEVDFSRPTMCM